MLYIKLPNPFEAPGVNMPPNLGKIQTSPAVDPNTGYFLQQTPQQHLAMMGMAPCSCEQR